MLWNKIIDCQFQLLNHLLSEHNGIYPDKMSLDIVCTGPIQNIVTYNFSSCLWGTFITGQCLACVVIKN